MGRTRGFGMGIGGLAAACLALASLSALAEPVSIGVIPKPQLVRAGNGGVVRVRNGTPIVVRAGDIAALHTARWLADLAFRSRGLRLVPTTAAGRSQPAIVLRRVPGSAQSEGYAIDIGRGRVIVQASSDAGLLYGSVTLWQLLTGGAGQTNLQSLHIEDQPRFAWRGLLLDSARHFQSPAFIERMIDWMALHKLNVLQWHLTDDQGWRLPIEGYPRLTTIGAWRVPASVGPPPLDAKTGKPRRYGGFYTRPEIRAIVAHGLARNVAIVPEIEMPGHALSALLAYPELSAAPLPPRIMQSDWGLIPDAFAVDDRAFEFLESVLGQVMDLFPSRFIDIGGDEVPLELWKASPGAQARMKALGLADEAALQNYFVRRIDSFLAAHGRRMIGWEEILQGGALPPDAAISSWRGVQSAVAATRLGHDVVLAVAPTLYFDNRQSDLANEPPGRGWVVSLHDVYAVDPGAPQIPPSVSASLGAADLAHILGLQGNLWTEHIRTEDRLAMMTFPRAAAVAEAGWTAQSNRDWTNFLGRLPDEFARFARLGLFEDQSAFAVDAKVESEGDGAKVTLSTQSGLGQIRYALDGGEPALNSKVYAEPLRVALPARIRAASFLDGRRISPIMDRSLDAASTHTRASQDLTLCAGTLPLNLEAEAVGHESRPVFLVQIMNPCWIWPGVDMAGVASVKIALVASPFNLRLGAELDKVVRRPSSRPNGEFQVRLDNCDTGQVLATLPLRAGAVRLDLASALPLESGVHALCFAYAGGDRLDPIWGIDKVELVPPGRGSKGATRG